MASVGQRGFTLIELMVTVAVFMVLMGLSFPLYISYQNRNNLSLVAESVVAALRRAETYARGANGDSAWGVAVQTGSVVLYKGASYAARDTTYDEMTLVPTNITTTGLNEVNFAKLTALPNATGTITLTTKENDNKAIAINAKGMVAY